MQVLTADEGVKKRLGLHNKTAGDFALTSITESVPDQYGNEPPSGVAADSTLGFAWTSESASKPAGVSGELVALQTVLDAMATVGMGERQRDGLLRGLAAVLHLGQVRLHNGRSCETKKQLHKQCADIVTANPP